MIVDGGVYDLTNFAQGERGGHPGGAEILVTYAGADGTAEFDFINHSKFAHRLLSRYRIGKLSSDCAAKALRKEDSSRHVLGKKHALKKRRVTVSVIQKMVSIRRHRSGTTNLDFFFNVLCFFLNLSD